MMRSRPTIRSKVSLSGNLFFFYFRKGIEKQASKEAYASQKTYARGHLLPAETYSFSDAHMLSTFTYTNAVPQIGEFNSGQWAQYEKKIREYATNTCSPNGGDLYLITGISEASIKSGPSGLEAIQGTLELLKPSGDAIGIPKSMWTAGCCISPSSGALGAFAVIGNNLKDKNKVLMSEVKMKELQGFLQTGVNGFGETAINLFPGNPGCSYSLNQVNFRKRPLPGE